MDIKAVSHQSDILIAFSQRPKMHIAGVRAMQLQATLCARCAIALNIMRRRPL